MFTRGRLIAILVGAGLAVAATWGLWLPAASADPCTITVDLVGGQVLTFDVNVPSGTPLSSIQLPITGTVASETESCSSSASSSSTAASATSSSSSSGSTSSGGSSSTSSSSTSTSSSTSSTTTSSSTSPSRKRGKQAAPKPSKPSRAQHPTSTPQKAKTKAKKKKSTASSSTESKAKHKSKGSATGVPSSSNPTYSLSLPGPAPIGVPNFFIDSFRIPPFLIPIYQAAGIEYDVPWQVLAAINEIETDYGRNLSVSSAGAVGWMQFLPSTWKEWGVDANGDGVADPYNPVDAIFTAARYLHAAGASTNLGQAIYAYNHADWYVQSVELRAQLIGGIPSSLIGALSGLVEGHFPVAAPAKYADSNVLALAHHTVKTLNAAEAIDSTGSRGTSIFARKGSPVIAVNDGKILKIGYTPQLGHYVVLQDTTGNVYTYSQLGSVNRYYPVPKAVRLSARQIERELALPSSSKAPTSAASAGEQVSPAAAGAPAAGRTPKITGPASAGTQRASRTPSSREPRSVVKRVGGATPSTGAGTTGSTAASTATVSAPLVKERLFAYPSRPASYAAGGAQQLATPAQEITSFRDYFSDTLHLARNQYTLQRLHVGSIVIAGTILGRIGGPSQGLSSHLYFQIRPAGRNAPYIDPKPILDGWKLLEATAVYRASGIDPFWGPGARNPTVGQVLLMSKEQLTVRVLTDPHVQLTGCGRRDIGAGLIDRRVLATIEFLSTSDLYPSITGLGCGRNLTGADGLGGETMDISAINGIPIAGHQGAGSITDIAIRRLLTLQGSMAPDEIVSDMAYKDQPSTEALRNHANRIQVSFTPAFGANSKLSAQVQALLRPGQWIQLINHLNEIPEPVVPIAPSRYAIRTQNP